MKLAGFDLKTTDGTHFAYCAVLRDEETGMYDIEEIVVLGVTAVEAGQGFEALLTKYEEEAIAASA